MKHASLLLFLVLALGPRALGQNSDWNKAVEMQMRDWELATLQEQQAQVESDLQAAQGRLSAIENDLYGWRDPTPDEVAAMRKEWDDANPFKTSFDRPDFTQHKIRYRRADAEAAKQQAIAEVLQERIADLEAKVASLRARNPNYSQAAGGRQKTPEEILQEREALHEYAVRAEADRQRRNAKASNPQQTAQVSAEEAAYNRAFAASMAEAIRLYPFASSPDTEGGKLMVQIEEALRKKEDPIYYDPNKPMIIARMAAKELHVSPKPTVAASAPNSNPPGASLDVLATQVAATPPLQVASPPPEASRDDPAAGQVPKILSATYGAGAAVRDVTDLVRQASSLGSFHADNATMGGDPASGKVKTLTIRYKLHGEDHEDSFSEGSTVLLGQTTHLAGSTRILSASYGADGTFRDVTTYAQAAARKGSWKADSSTLGGDPVFGKVKVLKIRYQTGEGVFEEEFPENSEVTLRRP